MEKQFSELQGYTEWCAFNSKIDFNDSSFRKILKFYLFECPSKHVSMRSKTFKEYGWTKSYQYAQMQSKLSKIDDNPKIPFFRVPVSDIHKALKENNQLNKLNMSQEVVIYTNYASSMETLFKSIRNALAHGSFKRKTYNKTVYYIFENRKPSSKGLSEIRARLILKESTLMQWIKIVQDGYKPKH